LILRLHRRAADEIREAAEWYHAREEGLELRFLAAVRAAFEQLEADPSQFGTLETLPKKLRFQRVLLEDFPYLIIYEQVESEVFVYAVAHASRRPNYWRRRKRERS
jgi:plasmid stabilization system protein ParE